MLLPAHMRPMLFLMLIALRMLLKLGMLLFVVCLAAAASLLSIVFDAGCPGVTRGDKNIKAKSHTLTTTHTHTQPHTLHPVLLYNGMGVMRGQE